MKKTHQDYDKAIALARQARDAVLAPAQKKYEEARDSSLKLLNESKALADEACLHLEPAALQVLVVPVDLPLGVDGEALFPEVLLDPLYVLPERPWSGVWILVALRAEFGNMVTGKVLTKRSPARRDELGRLHHVP